MAQRYDQLTEKLIQFIGNQKIFFVATACESGTVNISPKGMDSLRIVDGRRVIWLNVTGSGNETAAHIQENSRMTLMFLSFSGDPLILRLYGQARVFHRNDPDWEKLLHLFAPLPGARQIFALDIELVQTSCGMAVPFFDYVAEREQLNTWAIKKGENGLQQYWEQKNQFSLDGHPTHILEKNLSTSTKKES